MQTYNNVPYVVVNHVEMLPPVLANPLALFKNLGMALPWKQKMERLTEEILKLPEADIQTIHKFEDGLYHRTVIIPAGVVCTGAEHKTPYTVIVHKGTITVNTDEGIKTVTAPAQMEVAVGMERAGLTHDEEVMWTDIYVNEDNCKDLTILEDRLYVIPKCGLYDARKRLGHTVVPSIEEKK